MFFGVGIGVGIDRQRFGAGVIPGPVFDSDAQAFFDRVTTAGGTLSATEQTAIDTLVKQMKTDGIWTKMKAIYPMVGASAAACAQNLKSSSFTGTFTSGWTFASTGATPNGTSAFMNTGLNMRNNLSQNNSHISVYSRTNLSALSSMIGCYTGLFTNAIMLYPLVDSVGYFNIFSNGGNNLISNQNDSLSFQMLSRISSSSFDYYKRTTKTNLLVNSQTGSDLNLYVGANNSSGSGANFDARQNAFTSIGDGLNTTEATDFYTAVQAFQTTLNREV